MTDLATLTVRLETEISKFTAGLDKATSSLDKFGEHVTDTLKDIAGAFGLYLSVDALVEWGKSIIEQDAALDHFSQETGIAVDSLSRLEFALQAGGVQADQLGTIFRSLQKNITDATGNPTSQAAIAFKALGISLDSIKNASPEEVIKRIANSFSGLNDGANKSTIAVDLLGRGALSMIPTLNKGAQGIEDLEKKADALGITISTQTAKAAEEFETDLTNLGLVVRDGLGERIKQDLLPALDNLVKGFTDTATGAGRLDAAATGIADFFKGVAYTGLEVVKIFEELGTLIGGVAAAVSSPISESLGIIKETFADIGKEEAQFSAAQDALFAQTAVAIDDLGDSWDDNHKKNAANIAELEEQAKAYAAGIKSLEDYDAELQKQIGTFGKGKDASAAYALSQGKLAEALKITGAAGQDWQKKILSDAGALQTAKDSKTIADGLAGINAQIEKLQGQSGDSAVAELDKKNADLLTAARHQGNQETLDAYDKLVSLTAAQEDYNKDLQKEADIQKTLADVVGTLDAQKQKGALTDAQYQTASNAAYEQAATDLGAVRDNMQAIASATHNVQQQQGVDDLTAKITKLSAQADVAGAKLRTAFEDDATNALLEFENGTKSAGAAFTDFIGGIADDLLKLANKALVEQLFGYLTGATGGGAGTSGAGIFSTIAGLFGGGKAAGGDVNAGSAYKVNEAGGEYFIPSQNGRIQPASQMGGMTLHQHFIIQAPQGTVSRQTQLQIGAQASKGLATASRRNG